MYKQIAEIKLKSGQLMEVGVVITPDINYANELNQFLCHKPDHYKWHIKQCFEKSLDQLETRFYIGKLDGKIVSNIMTTEAGGVGILGHVFTLPSQRRKGACKAIMAHQMEDFLHRKGRLLYLGTGYDSAPYWIYHHFGFRSIYPESGFMKYNVHPDYEKQHFLLSKTSVKKVEWHDWSNLTALTGIVEGVHLRSTIYDIKGPTNFEGGFLRFKKKLETEPNRYKTLLLQSENGAVVAFANLKTRENKHGRLDLFAHPNFWQQTPLLIAEMDLPSGAVLCHTGGKDQERINILEKTGFKQESYYKTKDDQQILIFQN